MKKRCNKIINIIISTAIVFNFCNSFNLVSANTGDYYDVNNKMIYHPSDLTDINNIKGLINVIRHKGKIVFEFRNGVYIDYVKANKAISNGDNTVRDVLTKPEYRLDKKDFNNFSNFNECVFDVIDIY